MQGLVLAKFQALKTVLIGLLMAAPAAGVSAMLMDTRMAWPHATTVMLCIYGLTMANFLALVAIEPYRNRIGDLTIPALLLFISMIFAYTMTETIERFVANYGFTWLTPVCIVALAVIYGSVVREKFLLMRLFLCLNGLALTVLWCLGDADKVSLPF